jgi:peptide deformylase
VDACARLKSQAGYDFHMSISDWKPRLRIEQTGSPILHRAAEHVAREAIASPEVQQLIDMMIATLDGIGVGLAAPQVGAGLRIAIIGDPPELHASVPAELLREQERVPIETHVLINPTLIEDGDELAEYFEGCLSVDFYRAIVPRRRRIRVHALDRFGQAFEREASGWYARILQHEVDHLDGRLYVERMLPRTFVSAASYSQQWSKLPVAEAKGLLGADGDHQLHPL